MGYLKTGTTSFAHAMRRLGFSHYGYDRDLLRALERQEDQWLRDHNTTILELLADEPHLLRMNICAGDGYQKICSFLGLQDPGRPFPWANSAET